MILAVPFRFSVGQRHNNSFEARPLRSLAGVCVWSGRPASTQALGRKMKFNAGGSSIAFAALGSFLYLSGLGGLWIDYAPSVGQAVISAARDRAYVQLFSGVLAMIIGSAFAGSAIRSTPRLAAVTSLILAGTTLFPLAFWLFA